MQPKLIAAFKSALVEFSGSKTALLDQGYTSIINDSHFARVSKLLDNTSGKIVAGGKTNKETRKIEVTLVGDVTESDELLKSENFGPVLPILVKETMDEMIAYVNAHDQPLALYIFTNSSAHREYSKSFPSPSSNRTRLTLSLQSSTELDLVAVSSTTHWSNSPVSSSLDFSNFADVCFNSPRTRLRRNWSLWYRIL